MNYRLVIKLLGSVLVVLSVSMALSEGVVLIIELLGGDLRHETEGHARVALLTAAIIGGIAGGFMWLTTRKASTHLGRREALLLVAMSWIIGAALSALPFLIWAHSSGNELAEHPFRNPINCYFEATSGLTTTGATVLSDIEAVPPSLLFWRSLTHWLGGLGIVLLFVAVLPTLGVGGKRLFRVEAPGPEPEGMRPHIRDTARVLWFIYLGLTLAQVLALMGIGGMSLYDALCHTFATLATGGFSTENASVGAYESASVDIIVIGFMVLAGVNFGLYYQLFQKRWRVVARDPELRLYLILLLVSSAIVAWSITTSSEPIVRTTGEAVASDLGAGVREGVFTTVSIHTTTGFATSDFDLWPFIAQATLVMLMFIGGSAGSTGGGIKVIRIWLVFKVMLSELERAFRPNVIRPVKVGRSKVDNDMKLAALAYVLGIVVLFTVGSGLVMIIENHWGEGCSFTTAATASLATLCTIGPGLEKVGATQNYGWMTDATKCLLCAWMALGRLEVFAILVLFTPRFWKSD